MVQHKLLLGHTTAGKTTYVGLIYNSDDSRWDAIGVTTQA
jgi:hypothetical protein